MASNGGYLQRGELREGRSSEGGKEREEVTGLTEQLFRHMVGHNHRRGENYCIGSTGYLITGAAGAISDYCRRCRAKYSVQEQSRPVIPLGHGTWESWGSDLIWHLKALSDPIIHIQVYPSVAADTGGPAYPVCSLRVYDANYVVGGRGASGRIWRGTDFITTKGFKLFAFEYILAHAALGPYMYSI